MESSILIVCFYFLIKGIQYILIGQHVLVCFRLRLHPLWSPLPRKAFVWFHFEQTTANLGFLAQSTKPKAFCKALTYLEWLYGCYSVFLLLRKMCLLLHKYDLNIKMGLIWMFLLHRHTAVTAIFWVPNNCTAFFW